jgi:hypothetical protein
MVRSENERHSLFFELPMAVVSDTFTVVIYELRA